MRQRTDASGFTLIEVLVAFTIAALLLLPLLRSFSSGVASATRSDGFTAATLIGQSTLESVGLAMPLTEGTALDQQEGAYHVTASVHRYEGEGAPQGNLLLAIPFEIAVTVSWQEGTQPRSIALRTLRIGPPPAPEQAP
jgi:general secretion pathway protein I